MGTTDSILELKKTEDLGRYFALCGRRCYLIGTQDGQFPDVGWHTHQEMGGIWTHPIKIADGFWIGVDLPDEGREGYNPMRRAWLEACDEFILGDGGAWAEHRYNDPYVQTNWDILPRLKAVRREWVPKDEPAVVIDLELTSKDPSLREVQLNFLIRFEILPVWCSGWPDPIHVEAEFDRETGLVVAHGVTNNDLPFGHGTWSGALGCSVPPKRVAIGEQIWGRERTTGKGISALLKFPLTLDPSASMRFVLAADHTGEQGAVDTVNRVLGYGDDGLKKKVGWYRHVANELTSVDTPDELLNDGFLWSKMNLEWLTETSPILGTGVYAGLQDYAQYFGGDTDLSVGGLLAAGLHDEAKDALRILTCIGKKNKGRIPHELVTNGGVYSWGQIPETSLFSKCVWDTFLWTGDEAFLREMYPVCRASMLEYVPSQPSRDGILLIEYEDLPDSKRGKCCPHSVVAGYASIAKIAQELGDEETANQCRELAEHYRRQVEDLFWSEEAGVYASRPA